MTVLRPPIPITTTTSTNAAAAASTNSVAAAKPVNTQCPVSGKAVDLTKTVLYEGALVAFCCDDCKAQFQKDPKPFLSKLTLSAIKDKQQ